MFDVYCPRCAARVLLGPSHIVGVDATPDGLVLRYRCACGTVGAQVAGRRPRNGVAGGNDAPEALAG